MNRAARRRCRRCLLGLAVSALACSFAGADESPPPLVQQHRLFDGAVMLQTPAGWQAAALTRRSDAVDVSGDGLVFRLSYQPTELPADAFHAQCMLERQAPALELDAEVNYEYEYVGGRLLGRAALDSAYRVRYDEEIQGAREWRQRSLSLVGGGASLCVVQMAPAREWKRSRALRDLAASVLAGFVLR